MTHSLYHKVIRTGLIVALLTLLFDGGFVFPITKHLSENTMTYLANSVGVFAQIEPNELNVITAELTKREQELNEREAALREIEAREFAKDRPDYSLYVLSIITFILSVLIVCNYVLDWHRAHLVREQRGRYTPLSQS
jgi:hypothetical protein